MIVMSTIRPLAGTVRVKVPSALVVVPAWVLRTCTEAFATGFPFSSVTFPDRLLWAITCPEIIRKAEKNSSNCLMFSILVYVEDVIDDM